MNSKPEKLEPSRNLQIVGAICGALLIAYIFAHLGSWPLVIWSVAMIVFGFRLREIPSKKNTNTP